MDSRQIENRAKNLLTEYWNGELPVKLNKIIEDFNITVTKDILFDSSGIISLKNGEINCKINLMDSEEIHRYVIACAIGYKEIFPDDKEDYTFDAIKDYDNQNPNSKVYQAVSFALYLLMPEEAVKEKIEEGKKDGIVLPSLSLLYYSKKFKVPDKAIKIRFEELNIK